MVSAISSGVCVCVCTGHSDEYRQLFAELPTIGNLIVRPREQSKTPYPTPAHTPAAHHQTRPLLPPAISTSFSSSFVCHEDCSEGGLVLARSTERERRISSVSCENPAACVRVLGTIHLRSVSGVAFASPTVEKTDVAHAWSRRFRVGWSRLDSTYASVGGMVLGSLHKCLSMTRRMIFREAVFHTDVVHVNR